MEEDLEVLWIPSYGPRCAAAPRTAPSSCRSIRSGRRPSTRPGAVVLNPPSLARFADVVAPDGLLVVNDTLIEAESGRSDIEELRVPCTRLAKDAAMTGWCRWRHSARSSAGASWSSRSRSGWRSATSSPKTARGARRGPRVFERGLEFASGWASSCRCCSARDAARRAMRHGARHGAASVHLPVTVASRPPVQRRPRTCRQLIRRLLTLTTSPDRTDRRTIHAHALRIRVVCLFNVGIERVPPATQHARGRLPRPCR